MSRAGPGLRTAAGATLTALAATWAVVAVVALPVGDGTVTSYGAASPTAHALGLLAGLGLLVAGCLAVWLGPSRPLGVLLVAAGVLWWAPDAVGWAGGPPVVRGTGLALAPLLPVLLLGLLAATSGGRRRLVLVAVGGTAALSAGFVAVYDPFLDPDCWRTCTDTGLLMTGRPVLADQLGLLLAVARAAAGSAAVAVSVRRLVSASTAARRRTGLLLTGVVAAGAAEAVYGVVLLARTEAPRDALLLLVHGGRAVAWTVLAAAAAAAAWQASGRRRALRGLVAELTTGPRTGSLAVSLRGLTGDPQLDVLYPVGAEGRLVRADGEPAPATPPPGRVATPLSRLDQVVAVVLHDPDGLPSSALEELLGTAARLALDNERLAAEGLARTAEVRESRRRIVTTGDAARRQLERDLHDGAQQSLLALSYVLRLAASTAERSGQPVAAAELTHGVSLAWAALEELRELAHGIHPAVLSEAGLAVALRSLAERSPVPLELASVTTQRFDPSVELAAYEVVRAAAEHAGHDGLVVGAVPRDGALRLTVVGCDRRLPTEIGDRVAAVGGSASKTSGGVEVVLPCG